MSPETLPYTCLQLHLQALQGFAEHIAEMQREMATAKEPQERLLTAAFALAAQRQELHPFAQYLYFEAGPLVNRRIVTKCLAPFVKGPVLDWLCQGYTLETRCIQCQGTFAYEPTSFSDLRAYLRAQVQDHAGIVNPHRRCPVCMAVNDHDRSHAWAARQAQEKEERQRLCALRYPAYLQTPHWQRVRGKALRRAKFRCQLCNRAERLQVHHRSYIHRGEEHAYLEDVIVLCDPCHAKHHTMLAQPSEETATD